MGMAPDEADIDLCLLVVDQPYLCSEYKYYYRTYILFVNKLKNRNADFFGYAYALITCLDSILFCY